ncbi:MAG TPA: STAS domain-containing protein [Rhodocyclaceae bacterium]|nr:STAS domain-containing protein [Rhodocyclaceae bacterium]
MQKQITVSGEFAIFNAIALREQFLSAPNEMDSLEVNAGQVTEIDSTGVQLMLAVLYTPTSSQSRPYIRRMPSPSTLKMRNSK